MFFLMEEKDKEYLKEVQKITLTDYDIKDNLIKVDNLFVAIEDLLHEYNNLQEKFDDYKEIHSKTSDEYYVDTYIEEDKMKKFLF